MEIEKKIMAAIEIVEQTMNGGKYREKLRQYSFSEDRDVGLEPDWLEIEWCLMIHRV